MLCKVDKYTPEEPGYSYSPSSPSSDSNASDVTRIEIADLLSKGLSVKKEFCIKEIKPKLDDINIDASIQVSIFNMLVNPPKEPRMTKLAPIMDALFADVKESVVRMHAESKEAGEWTRAAEERLKELYSFEIESQTRRDIIQGIMTYYFLYELNNAKLLQDWRMKGGLK